MVRTPVQTNHMCDCPNRLHIDVVGTAGAVEEKVPTYNMKKAHALLCHFNNNENDTQTTE
jgi:hypothetical protein